MTSKFLDQFEEAVRRDEIFPFLAQVGCYKFGEGIPGYDWRPLHQEAYECGVIQFAEAHPEKREFLSKEIESVFMQMILFDYLHDFLRTYLDSEAHLRRSGKSRFNFNLESLRSELEKVTPLFKAQYDSEMKKNLRPQDIPDALVTGTAGRIVRLKDYLFHSGPSSQIPDSPLLDHKGRRVDWP